MPQSVPWLEGEFTTTVDLRPENLLLVKINVSLTRLLDADLAFHLWTRTRRPPEDPRAGFSKPPGIGGSLA